jgi:hypothetical protein
LGSMFGELALLTIESEPNLSAICLLSEPLVTLVFRMAKLIFAIITVIGLIPFGTSIQLSIGIGFNALTLIAILEDIWKLLFVWPYQSAKKYVHTPLGSYHRRV